MRFKVSKAMVISIFAQKGCTFFNLILGSEAFWDPKERQWSIILNPVSSYPSYFRDSL